MTTHGMSGHSLYGTWVNMMNRCYNWKLPQFKDWGGRGIKVCERWHDVRLFIEDIEASIGPRKPGMTLDRTDNDSDYAPGKVRWATRTEQVRNSRKYIDGKRSGPVYQLWFRLRTTYPEGVCAAWQDFDQFVLDIAREIGPRPPGMRFARLDDSLPYGPGNIGWVTPAEQIEPARAARLSRPYPVKHGFWKHPLYRIWVNLCNTQRQFLHETWLDIQEFIRDVEPLGPRPAGTVFRRIDPDGRFAPGNVCWGPPGRPPRSK